MELSTFYRIFQRRTQIACAIISVFLNFLLVLLIAFKSSKSIGFYKYLMMYIAVFEAVYSLLDVSVEPVVFAHGSAFITFSKIRDSPLGPRLSFLALITCAGCFGFSLALFAVHFFYRFGVIQTVFNEKYLKGSKLISLLLMPLVYGCWWTYLCSLFSPNPQDDDYMKERMMEMYGVKVEDVTYINFRFFKIDIDGKSEPNYLAFLANLCMSFMIVSLIDSSFAIFRTFQMSSMFCVFYFGTKCYRIINGAILTNHTKSPSTQSLQKQLFYALVIQTCIPLCLLYIPAGVLFATTIFEVPMGLTSSFVTITIAIYPAVDPLPSLVIIKDYRTAITSKFGAIKNCLIKTITLKKCDQRSTENSNVGTAKQHYIG